MRAGTADQGRGLRGRACLGLGAFAVALLSACSIDSRELELVPTGDTERLEQGPAGQGGSSSASAASAPGGAVSSAETPALPVGIAAPQLQTNSGEILNCPGGTHACRSTCAINTNVASCGSACTPCPAPTGGEATCDGTSCGGLCPPGSRLCAGACLAESEPCTGTCPPTTHDCSGTCQSDMSVASCGSSCRACPPPPSGGAATCTNGLCGIACYEGLHLCGTSCVRNDSISGCGSSCSACPAPTSGGVATCDGVSCGIDCAPGYFTRPGGCHRTAVAVTASPFHTCVIVSDGSVRCWGGNNQGQLGNASTVDSRAPVTVSNLSGALRIGAGVRFTCALVQGGTIQCWGENDRHQLGNGLTDPSSTPVNVADVGSVLSMDVGNTHSCAVLSNGGVRCWGFNGVGELGTAASGDEATSVAVQGLAGTVLQVAIGGQSSCALLVGGAIQCWGGVVVAEGVSTLPQIVTISGIDDATQLAQSSGHACVIVAGGRVRCWGGNLTGQLGNGTTTSSDLPIDVPNLLGVAQLALGDGFSCARLADRTVQCWGSNQFGKLGIGSTIEYSPLPQLVASLSDVVDIAAGANHACAVLADGTARCWGYNVFGMIGDLTLTQASTPTSVVGW